MSDDEVVASEVPPRYVFLDLLFVKYGIQCVLQRLRLLLAIFGAIGKQIQPHVRIRVA